MRRFKTAIVGGTFDSIHKGHAALLGAAFEAADAVVIGLVSDEFAASRGKSTQSYEVRRTALSKHIKSNYATRTFQILRLDNEYGPIATSSRVDVLVLSAETQSAAARLNRRRADLGVDPVAVIVVPMVLAADGGRISGTRIRRGEIDADGRLT